MRVITFVLFTLALLMSACGEATPEASEFLTATPDANAVLDTIDEESANDNVRSTEPDNEQNMLNATLSGAVNAQFRQTIANRSCNANSDTQVTFEISEILDETNTINSIIILNMPQGTNAQTYTQDDETSEGAITFSMVVNMDDRTYNAGEYSVDIDRTEIDDGTYAGGFEATLEADDGTEPILATGNFVYLVSEPCG